jgi:hypothetical protein
MVCQKLLFDTAGNNYALHKLLGHRGFTLQQLLGQETGKDVGELGTGRHHANKTQQRKPACQSK